MLKAKGYKKGSIVGDVFSLKKLFGKNGGNQLLSAEHSQPVAKHGLKWYKAQLIPITRICNFKKISIKPNSTLLVRYSSGNVRPR
jgi:hypothetical protein